MEIDVLRGSTRSVGSRHSTRFVAIDSKYFLRSSFFVALSDRLERLTPQRYRFWSITMADLRGSEESSNVSGRRHDIDVMAHVKR